MVRTDASVENIINLLELVLNNKFFTHDSVYYQQVFDCPMESPVSAILSNLVMEYVEETVLSSALYPPKWWCRFFDDSHWCLHCDYVEEFHSHLNTVNPYIQFTVEQETNRSLPFLDTVTTRQENGYIEVSVYGKYTHTDINISILSPLILYTTAQALSRPNPFQPYGKYSLFRRKTIRRNSTYFLCLVCQWVSQTISKELFKPKSAVHHRSKRRNHR